MDALARTAAATRPAATRRSQYLLVVSTHSRQGLAPSSRKVARHVLKNLCVWALQVSEHEWLQEDCCEKKPKKQKHWELEDGVQKGSKNKDKEKVEVCKSGRQAHAQSNSQYGVVSLYVCNSNHNQTNSHLEPPKNALEALFVTPFLESKKQAKSMDAQSSPHRAGTTRVRVLAPLF
jgi:hypothetical protein